MNGADVKRHKRTSGITRVAEIHCALQARIAKHVISHAHATERAEHVPQRQSSQTPHRSAPRCSQTRTSSRCSPSIGHTGPCIDTFADPDHYSLSIALAARGSCPTLSCEAPKRENGTNSRRRAPSTSRSSTTNTNASRPNLHSLQLNTSRINNSTSSTRRQHAKLRIATFPCVTLAECQNVGAPRHKQDGQTA